MILKKNMELYPLPAVSNDSVRNINKPLRFRICLAGEHLLVIGTG